MNKDDLKLLVSGLAASAIFVLIFGVLDKL